MSAFLKKSKLLIILVAFAAEIWDFHVTPDVVKLAFQKVKWNTLDTLMTN